MAIMYDAHKAVAKQIPLFFFSLCFRNRTTRCSTIPLFSLLCVSDYRLPNRMVITLAIVGPTDVQEEWGGKRQLFYDR
jgi:hypothetical protein